MMDDWVVAADDMGGYWLQAGGRVVAAQIGRDGVIRAADKREGDGATPCGRWPVRRFFIGQTGCIVRQPFFPVID